jgi:predicted O-linked N-acetylglucosamine transferase (SPINDLY family)
LFAEALRQRQQGKGERAETLCHAVLEVEPAHAGAINLLGVLAARRGNYEDAVSRISQAIALDGGDPDYRYNLGKVLELRGDADAAIASYREAIRLRPEHAEAWNNLAGLLLRQRRFEEAGQHAQRALALQPRSVGACNNQALAWLRLGRVSESEELLRRALSLDPGCADTHLNLAVVLETRRNYDEAIEHLRRALALDAGLAEAYSNLGRILKHYGKLKDALALFRKAHALNPNLSGLYSNILFVLNYQPDTDAQSVFSEHLAWAAMYAKPFLGTVERHPNDPSPERRIRIGYLSPDFRGHSVATFMQPIIGAHDRRQFEVVCYSDVPVPDQRTRWFEAHSDIWRDIVDRSDEEVAALVRQDRIDILVDLAGHTAGNRLLVFARKPAPVQASYLGYLNTTGLAMMDYRITDPYADPEGVTDRFHTEKLIRLPHSLWCYAPPDESPDVGPLPMLARNHVTFASFNNSAKVTPEVIALWAQILCAIPNAHLVMVTKGVGGVHDYFTGAFAAHGVAPERIRQLGMQPFQDYLHLHSDVDIALDPFPYTGGTTTFHTLWMGVPVITLAGSRPFSRSGVSILSTLGLSDWIGNSPREYVGIAERMVADPDALRFLREGLRARMLDSPLCDAGRFTRSLENAYRTMWRTWCESRR